MNGIESLIQKECMIASSSTPVSEDIIRKAEKNNVSLKAFTLCADRIIPVVNTANPVHKISWNQLKGVFTGKVSNWASLSGVDATIQIVLRHPTSGTYRVWNQKVLNEAPQALDFVQVDSNSGVLATVAENKHAIGYISKAYINPEVRQLLLTENGKSATIERRLLLYVDTNRLSKGIKSFISFLHSDPAKKIIISNGFVPVQDGSK
jgi:phosphate transport system substrate-binding protein